MKRLLVLLGILILVAIVVLSGRHAGRESMRQAQADADSTKSSRAIEPQQAPLSRPTIPAAPVAPENQPPRNGNDSSATTVMQLAKPSTPVVPPPPKQLPPQASGSFTYNGYQLQDPMARVVLSGVGQDDEATVYWLAAINDPSLPPEERKDLIEDLNEDGLSDPKHPTDADLPLIASRVALIEQLAPYALDSVNNDAFAEAYKDLVGLLNGVPPQ
jgi:hypothetical protein